jgi:hypothetical protein
MTALVLIAACSSTTSSPRPPPTKARVLNITRPKHTHATPPSSAKASLKASFSPTTPPSWLVTSWFVDPANSTTCALDTNNCTSSVCGAGGAGPCRTYGQITKRWGTFSPELNSDTTITFLSSHTDNSDPVIATPMSNAGSLIFTGPLTLVSSGTFGAVTPKNYSTGQALEANLGIAVGPVVGMWLVDTTHAGSDWVLQDLGSNVALLTQPLGPTTYGSPNTLVDTFTTGDSYTLYKPVAIDFVQLGIEAMIGFNGAATNSVFMQSVVALDPSGFVGFNDVYIGRYVGLIESRIDRSIVGNQAGFSDVNAFYHNIFAQGAAFLPSAVDVFGGAFGPNAALEVDNAFLDGSVMLMSGAGTGNQSSSFSQVYVASGQIVEPSTSCNTHHSNYATTALYGPGAIDVLYGSTFIYPDTASSYFLLTGGVTISDLTTACSVGVGASAVWNCGITITPAHIDAAVGVAGFGGSAIVPQSGGCITNVGRI